MLCAIAFYVPLNLLTILKNKNRNIYNDKVGKLRDYFEDNFISPFKRSEPCCPPSFALDLWNMFTKTNNELPKTKSSVQRWHLSFQVYVFSHHLVFQIFFNIRHN